MIDLEWYQSFVAVYQAGTVTAAAQARFLTQPAVTQHISALESAVGEPLFIRTPRRMLPTQRGKELYTQLIQSLERLEQISQQLRGEQQNQSPLIRLGTPREYFYERVLRQLGGLPFRFWISFGETDELMAQLERGELDVVLATKRAATKEVEFQLAYVETFLLVCSATHRVSLPDKAVSDLKKVESWLTSQKWLSYGVELPIIRRFWQLTFKTRPDFQAAIVIPDLHSIAKAVELGYGISLLPDYLCREGLREGRLALLWEPPRPVTNELWVSYRKIERNRSELKQVITSLQTAEF